MVTLAQIDIQIDAAWAAMNVYELSYTVRGRELVFHSLDAFQRHIKWLFEMREALLVIAAIAAGNAVCPVVQFINTE